ncbi:RICIN domain-containing protein [Streptomyces marispadix]|uniref:Ricin B lectin domain-containing protein n=1 Tax=Streptomyces marispadix TaxID=2922868 RepID=A0ABS9SZ75_9ACTN|nr:hypothetical protein [Streptomyces marispadix]MCH6161594.1 hypothetical protein [Streptomyces marispadix]
MRNSRFRVAMAAVAALVGALGSGSSAQAAPAAPVAAGAVPTGSNVVITNNAYSNYLIPDDTKGKPGTYLQVYYADNHPYPRTFTFEPVSGREGIYKWKHSSMGACAETQGSGKVGTSVYLQECNSNKAQWWVVRLVHGTGDQFVISPYNDESLAVTGLYGNDNIAPLRELPSATTSTAPQRWHIDPR